MTDLCAIADVQALTQVTYGAGTTPTNTQVTGWVTDASAFIEESTGRKYAEQTVTAEYHDGNGTFFIMLDFYPITTITSLTVDDAALTENTDYWVKDRNAGVIECKTRPNQRTEGSSIGHRSILCAYKYGITTIPTTAKELCAVIVAIKALNAAANVGSSGEAVKSYQDGDVSITYSDSDKRASWLVERYKELMGLLGIRLGTKVGALE